MDNKVEVWKQHPDLDKLEVSSFGRVRTVDRIVPSSWNRTRLVKGRVLKQSDNGTGYLKVGVKINGKWNKKFVHRLVAQTFIKNPDNLPMVNHRDCNIKNNHVENLEFCTASYNRRYQEEFGKSQGHPVLAINLTTLEVSRFKSQSEASRALGIFQESISRVIKGRYKYTGGYRFENAK